jgi:hypothetical protein
MEWLWIVLGRECLDLSGIECVRSAFEPLSDVEIFKVIKWFRHGPIRKNWQQKLLALHGPTRCVIIYER